jgi:hypothetical protein
MSLQTSHRKLKNTFLNVVTTTSSGSTTTTVNIELTFYMDEDAVEYQEKMIKKDVLYSSIVFVDEPNKTYYVKLSKDNIILNGDVLSF